MCLYPCFQLNDVPNVEQVRALEDTNSALQSEVQRLTHALQDTEKLVSPLLSIPLAGELICSHVWTHLALALKDNNSKLILFHNHGGQLYNSPISQDISPGG